MKYLSEEMKLLSVLAILALQICFTLSQEPVCLSDEDEIFYDTLDPGYKRIVSGKPIEISQAPYQVSITNRLYFICGGVLISPQFVLTAAHCLSASNISYELINPTSHFVRVGTNNADKGGKLYEIESVRMNEDAAFINTTIRHDLGLIKLKEKVDITQNVKPICLNPEAPEAGDIAFITGYGDKYPPGSKFNQGGQQQPILMGETIPIISNKECKRTYGSLVAPEFVCARQTTGTGGTCHGDSGGPITVNGALVGVTSWGIGKKCGELPSVFTKVSSYMEWITNTIEEMTAQEDY